MEGNQEAAEPHQTAGETGPPKPPEPTMQEIVAQIYSRYLHHHPRAAKVLNPDHREFKLIRSRLQNGFSVEDLQAAIDGNHISPFHCGENRDGATYHSLQVIFRDTAQVTKFIEIAQGDQKQRPDRLGNQRAANEYLAMFPPEAPPENAP